MAKVVGTGTFGRTSVETYQITPVGAGRIQAKNLPKNMNPATIKVLAALAELGGLADDDELRLQTTTNPGTIRVALRRLIDMGLVTPVMPPGTPGIQAVTPTTVKRRLGG